MTAPFNDLVIGDYFQKRQYNQEHPKGRLQGWNYVHPDGNTVTNGKIKIDGVVTERGIFWNKRLIIPESLINGANIPLENVRCVTDHNGIRREGLFYKGKLIRGSLIHSTQAVFSGVFDEKERLIKGTITQNISYFPYTFEGTFKHLRLEEMDLIECQGTMTYAISQYQESGTIQFVDHPILEAKTDHLGRKIIGRISFSEYNLDGVFTYSPNGRNILCEGTKICAMGSYKALGVFVNCAQLKGKISYHGKGEEFIPDQIQGNEWLLESFMAQDVEEDFYTYCKKIEPIPPFRLHLDL